MLMITALINVQFQISKIHSINVMMTSRIVCMINAMIILATLSQESCAKPMQNHSIRQFINMDRDHGIQHNRNTVIVGDHPYTLLNYLLQIDEIFIVLVN